MAKLETCHAHWIIYLRIYKQRFRYTYTTFYFFGDTSRFAFNNSVIQFTHHAVKTYDTERDSKDILDKNRVHKFEEIFKYNKTKTKEQKFGNNWRETTCPG